VHTKYIVKACWLRHFIRGSFKLKKRGLIEGTVTAKVLPSRKRADTIPFLLVDVAEILNILKPERKGWVIDALACLPKVEFDNFRQTDNYVCT
jgi:hypothetical protein